jgi:hypothetical protein
LSTAAEALNWSRVDGGAAVGAQVARLSTFMCLCEVMRVLARLIRVQTMRDVRSDDDLNSILALWARSFMLQQQFQISQPASDATAALQMMRRLLLLARPTDDDIVFM